MKIIDSCPLLSRNGCKGANSAISQENVLDPFILRVEVQVVFLDIDGVLVTEHHLSKMEKLTNRWRDALGKSYFCPRCVKNVALLVQQTGARVVLSSSWRIFLEDLPTVQNLFEQRQVGFAIYDLTPVLDSVDSEDQPATRGEEIQAWLAKHPEVVNYCILDDDPQLLPHQKPYWVRTSFRYGFTRAKLEKALSVLMQE